MANIENPYAPPKVQELDPRDATWYLLRIQCYFRWMGYGMLTYLGLVGTGTIVAEIYSNSVRWVEYVLPLLWCAFLGWLCVTMVRIGKLTHEKFPMHYQKSRWVAILSGLLMFPFLTIPAIICVRRLTRWQRLNETPFVD